VRVALLFLALFLVGCGTTKVVVHQRTQTQTVTRTITQAATTPAAPEPTIYVDTSSGLLYKPDSINVYGGHQFVAHIRWVRYGGATAFGKADFGRDDCNPDCATGHYTYTPITVTLIDRQLCHGATAYTSWSFRGAGLDATAGPIVGPNFIPCE
jgi:hypothetical protein